MGKAKETNSQQGADVQREASLKTTGSETDVANNTENGVGCILELVLKTLQLCNLLAHNTLFSLVASSFFILL